jgi:hypothetical protein
MKRLLLALLMILVATTSAEAAAKKKKVHKAKPQAVKEATGTYGPAIPATTIPRESKQAAGDTNPPVARPEPVPHGAPTESQLTKASGRKFDLRSLPRTPPPQRERAETEPPDHIPVQIGPPIGEPGSKRTVPSVPVPNAPAPPPNAVYEGLDRFNWGAGSPPDTNGDAGPTYYIQTVNTSIGIYRKSDGFQEAAFTFNTFMSQGGFGNLCDTNNFGDPVVLYDSFDDRWIITDFAFLTDGGGNPIGPAYQCFAASMNGNPLTGGWNFYSTQINDFLNDYPKFGIWPDGLYMSANMFGFGGGPFSSARAFAFNKAQMYAGSPIVNVVSFNIGGGEFTAIPSNARLQTGTPPPGRPNLFVSTWLFTNALTVYKFHVDWNNLSLSTLTGPDTPLAPTSWPNVAVGNAGQPGTATLLDVLQIRAMVQNQYTNFGGTESLWLPHTVRRANTSGVAAPRWYQIDVSGGTVAASTVQTTTWDPDNANIVNRFMPSLAVDRAGNMAMGYSVSAAVNEPLGTSPATNCTTCVDTFPSIRYAGRLAGDPVNTFSQTEQTFFTGTASQTGTTRWGDYSSMTLDPDGCTFWYTTEYANPADQTFNHRWLTKFGSIGPFPGCTPVGAGGTVSGTVTVNPGGAPIASATVNLGGRSATTDGSGNYTFPGIPAGTYPSMTASKGGFVPGSASSIVVTDGGTTTQNFSLTAAAASACLTDTTQSDFLAGVPSTTIDLTTSPGDVKLTNAPSVDQQNQAGTTTGTGFGTPAPAWTGQTFIAGVTGQLVKTDITLFCNGCGATPPNLTLSVRATSAGLPTGADLASTTVPGSTFASGAITSFQASFGSPATLTSGTQYALILRPVSVPAGSGYFWIRSSPSTYAGGSRVITGDSGATWSADTTRDYNFRTYMYTGYAPSGTLSSSIRDANPAGGITPIWSTMSWNATTPANTSVKFQVAGSNNAGGPFTFVGPDGTAGTFFTTSPVQLQPQFYNFRYLRYKAFLATTDGVQTPVLSDVTLCFNDVDCSATPPITPTPAQVCANTTGNTASGPAGATSYAWSITNGSITGGATSQTVTYTAGASGSVGLLLNVVLANGCHESNSINVTINPIPPPPTIDGADGAYCSGALLTSSAPAGNQWYKDGILQPGATNQTFAVTQTGSYTVTATDGNNCTSGFSAPRVVSAINNIPATPTISADTNGTGTQDQACPEQPLTLHANGAPTATSYQWYKDIDLLPGETNATYQATGAATYYVTATNSCGTTVQSAGYVVQNPTPHSPFVSFRGQDSSVTTLAICQGSSQIIDSDSATGIQWWKDGAPIPGANSQSYTATQAGIYTAQLNALGCHSQFGRNVTITVDALPPTPTISGDTNGTGTQDQACPEQPLTLHANGATGAQSYTWYSDAAVIPGETSSTLVMTGVGNISVTATNGTCTTAHSATYVVQNPTPHSPFVSIRSQPSTTTSIAFCQGSSAILDSDSATGIQWWKDGSPIPGPQTQSLTVTQSGVYTAQLDALGCHSQFGRNITVTVNPLPPTPTVTPGGPTTFCAGGSVTLTSSAGSGNQWNLNGSPIGGATGTTYNATASGSYTVTVTDGNNCSATSAPTSVTVNPLPPTPTVTPGGPTTFCAGGSVTLTSSAGSGNQWKLNGSPIGGATGTTYNATASGTYTVTVTDGNGCSATSAGTSVTVNPLPPTPTVTPGGPTTFCSGGSVTLTSSAGSGNQWKLNGSPIGGATSTTYNATASGTYTVTVTDGNGCSATSAGTSVTVNPLPPTPTITPGGPTTFCTGGSVTLTSSSASGNQWKLNGSPIGGATGTTYNATASGSYTVTVTDGNGCSATSAATAVTVNPNPNATITAASPVPAGSTGNTASVANAGGGATYNWSITNGTITGGTGTNSITYTAGGIGTVTLQVTVTVSGCSDTKSKNVTVVSAVTVTSITPNNGSAHGGQPVTINGTGFLAGATVTIGGTAATNVVVVSSTKITAKTPGHVGGTVNVVVTNTDTGSGTLVNGFTYHPQNFDPNNDGTVDPADVFYLVNYLFLGGPAPNGPAGMLSGDANGDGVVDPADIFYVVHFVFDGGPAPQSVPSDPRLSATSERASLSGTVSLGEPLRRLNGTTILPVIVSIPRGGEVPRAIALKIRGASSIARAGAALLVKPVFETSQRTADGAAYIVSFPADLTFTGGTAVVAEVAVTGNAKVELDPALTMLSDAGGLHGATVSNKRLQLGDAVSVAVPERTPRNQ